MFVTIVRAQPSQAEALTELAYESKASWNYPEHWLELWREGGELEVSQAFIEQHPTFAAFDHQQCVGFYSLILQEDKAVLEHLFIKPTVMGQGVGRQLFEHAVATARALNFEWLELEADPNAQVFYERMGMTKIDEKESKLSELLGERRVLPIMELHLSQETRYS